MDYIASNMAAVQSRLLHSASGLKFTFDLLDIKPLHNFIRHSVNMAKSVFFEDTVTLPFDHQRCCGKPESSSEISGRTEQDGPENNNAVIAGDSIKSFLH